MKFFTLEDFQVLSKETCADYPYLRGSDIAINNGANKIADIANAILEERGTKVYAEFSDEWKITKDHRTAYQALIVCIEEIPKKECAHEPYPYTEVSVLLDGFSFDNGHVEFKCRRCGVKLLPTVWWPAE